MTPREFFPKMPDEVFDMWLSPFIEEVGWPFRGIEDRTDGTRWHDLLVDIPLRVLHGLEWNLVEVDLASDPLSTSARMSILGIIQHCVEGRLTLVADLKCSKERFRACADFILKNGRIPKPLVCVRRDRGFDIVDGSHRAAALCSITRTNLVVPAWVAEL